MSKLAIYQGDALDRELDLDRRALQFGRGDHNDVVLPDSSHTVSRQHAELRYENGGYVLYDLDSPNGIWAGKRRQLKIALEPNEPVTIGPYTLILRDLPAVDGHGGQEPPSTSSGWDGTYVAAGNRARSAGPVRGQPEFARPSSRWSKPLVFTAFALVIGLLLMLLQQKNEVVTRLFHRGEGTPSQSTTAPPPMVPAPRFPAEEAVPQRVAAEGSGRVQATSDAVPPAEPVPPLPEPARVRTVTPESAVAAEPPRPIAIDRAPAVTPPDRSAASAASIRSSTPRPATVPAVDDPLWAKYESARNTLLHGSLQEALTLFCAIDLDYRDVKEQIEKIGNGMIGNVPKVLQQAGKLEAAGALDQAFAQYDLAAKWNTSLRSCPWAPHNDWQTASSIIEATRRVRDRMTQEGEAALKQASADDALGRPQARTGYERALRFLADDHPKKNEIRQRLEELGNNK